MTPNTLNYVLGAVVNKLKKSLWWIPNTFQIRLQETYWRTSLIERSQTISVFWRILNWITIGMIYFHMFSTTDYMKYFLYMYRRMLKTVRTERVSSELYELLHHKTVNSAFEKKIHAILNLIENAKLDNVTRKCMASNCLQNTYFLRLLLRQIRLWTLKYTE